MKRLLLIALLILCLPSIAFCESGWQGTQASDVKTDTLYFNNNLSILDDTTQKALETLDNVTDIGSGVYLKLNQTTPQTVINGAPIFSANLVTPKVIGGSATTSDLFLQTTSGVGAAGADMHFLVGNNGATEGMTILNGGNVGIGTTSPSRLLTVNSGAVLDITGLFTNSGTKGMMFDWASTGNKDVCFRMQSSNAWTIGIDNSNTNAFTIAFGNNWMSNITSLDKFLSISLSGVSYFNQRDATTNTVSEVMRLTHSGGAVANGFGTGLDFYLEDATAATIQQASRIGTLWTDAADATRTSAITFSGVSAGGALTEWGRFNLGNLLIGTTDTDGTPATGKLVVKGTTNDGSTNIFVGRDSAEANVITIDTDGIITPGGYKSSDGSAGLSNTYTFGGGASGNIATMTFKNGLLTAVTTVP